MPSARATLLARPAGTSASSGNSTGRLSAVCRRAVAAHQDRAAITGLLERRPELVLVVGDQAIRPGAGGLNMVRHLGQQGTAHRRSRLRAR